MFSDLLVAVLSLCAIVLALSIPLQLLHRCRGRWRQPSHFVSFERGSFSARKVILEASYGYEFGVTCILMGVTLGLVVVLVGVAIAGGTHSTGSRIADLVIAIALFLLTIAVTSLGIRVRSRHSRWDRWVIDPHQSVILINSREGAGSAARESSIEVSLDSVDSCTASTAEVSYGSGLDQWLSYAACCVVLAAGSAGTRTDEAGVAKVPCVRLQLRSGEEIVGLFVGGCVRVGSAGRAAAPTHPLSAPSPTSFIPVDKASRVAKVFARQLATYTGSAPPTSDDVLGDEEA